MLRAACALWTVVAALAGGASAGGADANSADRKPASNLEYWLNQATPVTTQPTAEGPKGTDPFEKRREVFLRSDALPGVIELSNGKQLPGGVFTTRDKPWVVWNESTKSWRRIPFLNLLSISAVVEEERVELKWRWKGMGEPEKVYTGEKYPWRRLYWRFKLIDGSVVDGDVRGQPVSVEFRGKTYGPFVLHERMKGEAGQTLQDLLYVRKVVVSRKMMEAVIVDREKQFEQAGRAGGDDVAGGK